MSFAAYYREHYNGGPEDFTEPPFWEEGVEEPVGSKPEGALLAMLRLEHLWMRRAYDAWQTGEGTQEEYETAKRRYLQTRKDILSVACPYCEDGDIWTGTVPASLHHPPYRDSMECPECKGSGWLIPRNLRTWSPE